MDLVGAGGGKLRGGVFFVGVGIWVGDGGGGVEYA